jgi:hypothetical protein
MIFIKFLRKRHFTAAKSAVGKLLPLAIKNSCVRKIVAYIVTDRGKLHEYS